MTVSIPAGAFGITEHVVGGATPTADYNCDPANSIFAAVLWVGGSTLCAAGKRLTFSFGAGSYPVKVSIPIGNTVSIPFGPLFEISPDGFTVTGDDPVTGFYEYGVVGAVGPSSLTDAPSVAVVGISGGTKIPVSVDTSVTPLVVQGKAGGVAQPVSGTVAVSGLSGSVTVDTSTPLAVKTTGTNTVKVIPG